MTSPVVRLDAPDALRITLWRAPDRPDAGERRTVTWSALADMMRSYASSVHVRTGWSPAVFSGDYRRKANAETVSALALDFDDAPLTLEGALELYGAHKGLVSTTRHHRPEQPKLRVALALSRPVSTDEHAQILAHFRRQAAELGFESDDKCTDPSRFWFWGGACEGCSKCEGRGAPADEQRVVELEGLPVDVDDLLERLAIESEPVAAVADAKPEPHATTGRDQKRARAMLEHYVGEVERTPKTKRNATMSEAAFCLGGFAHHGLDEELVVSELVEAARRGGWDPSYMARHAATARRQFREGAKRPRDLPEDDSPAAGSKPSAAPSESAFDGTWLDVPQLWMSDAPPPRRWLVRHPTRDGLECAPGQGDGVLPLGRVGVLAAAGGAGKTMLLVQLALSIATGRPWLGHLQIGERGRVLLGLAEETPEECHRRLYTVASALELSADDRELVTRRVVVLPLMGKRPALVAADDRGNVAKTTAFAELRHLLEHHAGNEGWRLLALDPMSRWLPGSERDNDVATAALTVAESLCSSPGDPTVLISAHSSKLARRLGAADTRGVTGIVDAARWEAQLRSADGEITLEQTKSNYSAPWRGPLVLARERGGVLRVVPAAEREALAEERDEARAEAKAARKRAEHERVVGVVVATVRDRGADGVSSVDGLAAELGVSRAAVRSAMGTAVDRGLVVRTGQTRASRYVVPEHAEVSP